ncbi:MAG TPA: L-seryl-tRNA(Sec) selenium transferase [Bryobacteraceae bacterium]|nr:L-seryl-tRNA(Sec) selenium transferase [Bryobacteraceae bacterium]
MIESEKLRELPAVHELVERLAASGEARGFPRHVLVAEARRAIDQARAAIRSGDDPGEPAETRAARAVAALADPSLRRVINATGVVLHTNLGRAPLGPLALHPGYTNLEYDLTAGRRGKRDVHTGALLSRLTGAPSIAVNNNAAAVYLALNELAAGGEAIVSRGELIEIGDGFRIPDIIARAGAVLREVGTTNRTHIADYRDALTERTRLILRVHPSNFRITGFTARPALDELAALARERGIPLYEDLGSGCLADLRPFGIDEPLVSASLSAGADLVSFSGDKLLGGPQAGILAGRADLVARLRRNPIFRALRLDKLMIQVLEETARNVLLERWERIPALAMIRQSAEEIRHRAERLLSRLTSIPATLAAGESMIGGGSTPEQPLPTCLIVVDTPNAAGAELRLRSHEPPVITRIEGDRLLIDLRTVFPAEEEELLAALQALS